MKDEDKQFLKELKELLARYDAVVWFDCEAIEGIYGDHLEICRGFDNRVVFKTDNGEWCIRCNDLPKE